MGDGETAGRRRLTRQDWVDAGLRALNRSGPAAVRIEPLATALHATKGSGYWHFGSRADLLRAVLDSWLQVGTRDVVSAVEQAGGDPRARLHRLLAVVTQRSTESPGDLLVIGSTDELVREVVVTATRDRVAYVRGLLVQTGLPRGEAGRRAVLAYSAYLGFATLAAATPELLPTSAPALRRLQQSMTDVLLAPLPG